MYRKNARCPWGAAQTRRTIAEGITFVTTAGHGGYILSKERYEEMPEHLKACSFTGDQFFEEDCSWCGVVLAFPQFFDSSTQEIAKRTYAAYYTDAPFAKAGAR